MVNFLHKMVIKVTKGQICDDTISKIHVMSTYVESFRKSAHFLGFATTLSKGFMNTSCYTFVPQDLHFIYIYRVIKGLVHKALHYIIVPLMQYYNIINYFVINTIYILWGAACTKIVQKCLIYKL